MFRVKIALLTILLSGSVLVGFGLYSLGLLHRVGMDRVDREIMALGGGQLHRAVPSAHWRDFDRSLRYIYGPDRLKDLAVQIRCAGNEVLYQSDQWPEGIAESAFPDFDHALESLPYKFNEPGSGRPDARFAAAGPFPGPDEDFRQLPFPPHGERPDLRNPPVRIKKPFFQTIANQTGSWRVGIMGNQHITVLLGLNMEGFYQDERRYRKAFWSIAPVALLLLAGGGWIIAHRALRPVALITRTAESITARALDQRVPETAADRELSRLAAVINSMLDRLQLGLTQAMRFSADAAHELQTPLTVLQGELDEAVQHAPVGSDEQRRYGALLEEAQRLKAIVQKLLILARADAGRLSLNLEHIDLSAMIESAVEDAGAVAPHLRIERQIAPAVAVKADPVLLRQVIQNLASNAVKYNKDRGLIRFRLSLRGSRALFTISNTGSPIPADERDRIFDRFYRVDRSRSRAVPGAGLGLSLAREIANAHRGELRLEPGTEGLVSFSLSLPSSSC